jgi:hypothetical protein
MGMMVPVLRLLLREHKRRPLHGRGLLVGRQTVPLTLTEAEALIKQEGLAPKNTDYQIDVDTRSAKGTDYITEKTFFQMFSDLDLVTLDVTDYEGAEIVHDLQSPPPGRTSRKI